MFQLVTNQVEFNINYVILLNMIMAFKAEYLPYGLLLTSLFELYHLGMPRILAEKIEYCDIINLVKSQVPLKDCSLLNVKSVCIAPEMIITGNKGAVTENSAELVKLKDEVASPKEMNLGILARLDNLENKNKDDSTVGKNEGINEKMYRLLSEEMVNEMVEKSDKMADDEAKKPDMLPGIMDLSDDLGFVAVNGPEKA
nr:PREDICTED: uncharacterized protein LOC108192754 [Daucus carota subsp. sativus]